MYDILNNIMRAHNIAVRNNLKGYNDTICILHFSYSN